MNPIISIIVPCYNTEKYLNKCIDSVLNSTFKDLEIKLIDDGSKDNTYKILEEYAKKDNRVRIYTQENIGQAKTRNKAINLAKGKYLFFLDSDDYIDLDLLEKLYNETKNSDIVVSDAKGIDEFGKELNIIKFIEYSDNSIKNYILNSSGPAWILIKKDIITKNKLYFYEDHIYEDIAVVPAWGIFANNISYVPNTYYYYLQRSGSTMNQTTYSKKLEDIFYSLEYLKNIFKDKYTEEIEFIYIEHLLHAASLRFYKFGKLDMIDKISDIMKENFKNWNKNTYFQKQTLKYKIVCSLFYKKSYKLLKLILK